VGADSSRTGGWRPKRARGRLMPSPCCPRAGCGPLRLLEGRERPEGAANALGLQHKTMNNPSPHPDSNQGPKDT